MNINFALFRKVGMAIVNSAKRTIEINISKTTIKNLLKKYSWNIVGNCGEIPIFTVAYL